MTTYTQPDSIVGERGKLSLAARFRRWWNSDDAPLPLFEPDGDGIVTFTNPDGSPWNPHGSSAWSIQNFEITDTAQRRPGESDADVIGRLLDAAKDKTVNPKEAAGAKKPAIYSVFPRWIVLVVGRVMSVGAAKYGKFNYRESSIAASTYEDAIERHAALWFDGEDNDPETGVSHLGSVIASCVLLMDAQATGKLDDDRQKTGLVRGHLNGLEALLVSLPLPARKA